MVRATVTLVGRDGEPLRGAPVTVGQLGHAFGFGKGAAGASYPSLFLVGTIEGVRGIFRSDDAARSWVRINDDRHQWGLVLLVTGDPRIHGRVYVGTHGRGALYGDPIGPAK